MNVLNALYILVGIVLGAVALFTLSDRTHTRRYKAACFWAINATLFGLGSWLPPFLTGVMVIVIVLLVGFGGLGRSQRASLAPRKREARAKRWGNRLFLPMILIPVITLSGTVIFKTVTVHGQHLIEPAQATLTALALGIMVAFIVSLIVVQKSPVAALREGTRLYDSIGWTLILPQMLAALGSLFALAGVGEPIARLLSGLLPLATPWVAVVTYCLGMTLLTVIMGNALAVFPIMTIGVGLPIITQQLGGNPAIMASLGMLCGFCGNLMTPMAANFNTVPATLLHLSDPKAVIRVQLPTALAMLCINTLLMLWLVFRV